MPLELHPLEEADLGIATDVIWKAFEGGLMSFMYPNGVTDADRQHSINSTLKSWRKHPDTIRKFKVIDTDLPADDPFQRIVGISDWKFYPKQRSEEELDEEMNEMGDDPFPPSADKAKMEEFFGGIAKARREHMGGKPYVLLHILVTLPKYHRRGVGAMHMQWGFEQAEKMGLPVWLEASKMGRPLYERNGFETVGWLDVDLKSWGADPSGQNALMLRPVGAKSKSS